MTWIVSTAPRINGHWHAHWSPAGADPETVPPCMPGLLVIQHPAPVDQPEHPCIGCLIAVTTRRDPTDPLTPVDLYLLAHIESPHSIARLITRTDYQIDTMISQAGSYSGPGAWEVRRDGIHAWPSYRRHSEPGGRVIGWRPIRTWAASQQARVPVQEIRATDAAWCRAATAHFDRDDPETYSEGLVTASALEAHIEDLIDPVTATMANPFTTCEPEQLDLIDYLETTC